mgnify:CR=1 FL=1
MNVDLKLSPEQAKVVQDALLMFKYHLVDEQVHDPSDSQEARAALRMVKELSKEIEAVLRSNAAKQAKEGQ